MLTLLFQSNDLHWNMTCRRIQLEMVQHCPAEHVGQKNVERNGGWEKLLGKCQPTAPLLAMTHLNP